MMIESKVYLALIVIDINQKVPLIYGIFHLFTGHLQIKCVLVDYYIVGFVYWSVFVSLTMPSFVICR